MQIEFGSSTQAPRAADGAFSVAPGTWTREALRPVVCSVLLAAAVLLAYYPTIRKLTGYWASNDMYSYGFLVPFISGYLIWLRRGVLAQIPRTPSFGLGVPVLAAALLLFIVGSVSSTNVVEELSLPVAICGVVLLVLGRHMTQALLFPLAYLLTMIPFWDFLTNRLHEPFQLYSAAIGVSALRLLDIPVFRDGIFIHLPNITLEVADLCSGVNHLVAVLCIGVPVAHLFVKRWPVRVFIVTTAAGIALLSNGVRVGVVSLFAYYGVRGTDGDIHGPFALFRSLLISGVGFVVLFWLISRFADRTSAPESARGEEGSRRPSPGIGPGLAVALALAMLVGTVAFTQWHDVRRVSLVTDLGRFPQAIGRWRVSGEKPFSPGVSGVGFDHTLSRSYSAPDGTELDLLLGYFERQEQGRELVGYKMSRVIWTEDAVSSRLGGDVAVSDFVTRLNGDAHHVTYWYLLNGRTTSREYQAKWWTTWNSLLARRSNGGIVVIRVRMRADERIEASRARVRDFIDGVMVATRGHFPA